MVNAEQLKTALNLKPLHGEGGFFAESYRSEGTIPRSILPPDYDGDRAYGTAIYYLLTPETMSAMHRLCSDEVFHFYLGDPVEMLQLHSDGSAEVITLGPDLLDGMRLQVVVPKGTWQGLKLIPGGKFALLGANMAPGFEFADYEAGDRESLLRAYPAFEQLIVART